MKLTHAERLALWNQYEILKHLDPEQASDYEQNQEIVSSGYELLYSELNPSVYADTISEEVGSEVHDILDMFRAIHFSSVKHGLTPSSSSARFEGFDGNESTGHHAYARFVRRSQGRWDELSDRPDNSHSSMSLPHYRDMLKRWEALGRPHDLTPAHIDEIAG